MEHDIYKIYTEYRIQPFLQLHQIRVAAVAAATFDMLAHKGVISTGRNELISACLLHDMGNIIKFDLSRFPESNEPEGLLYWKGVQDEYIQKYNGDVHEATYAIAEEIGVSELTKKIIASIGYSRAYSIANSHDALYMIANYADMRVMPSGIVSIEERLADARERYGHRPEWKNTEEVRKHNDAIKAIEKELFGDSDPSSITDASTEDLQQSLKHFSIC